MIHTPMTNSRRERERERGRERERKREREREMEPPSLSGAARAHDITKGYAHTFRNAVPAHRQHRPSDFLPFSVEVPSTAAGEPHGKLVVDVLIKRAGG